MGGGKLKMFCKRFRFSEAVIPEIFRDALLVDLHRDKGEHQQRFDLGGKGEPLADW